MIPYRVEGKPTMKTERELTELLEKLILRWEDEFGEFKEGGAGFSTHDIGSQ